MPLGIVSKSLYQSCVGRDFCYLADNTHKTARRLRVGCGESLSDFRTKNP